MKFFSRLFVFCVVLLLLAVGLGGCGSAPSFTLKLEQEGEGLLVTTPSKPIFNNGEKVTVTAFPGSNHYFSHFVVNGDIQESNPLTLEVRKNTTVKGYFVPEPTDPSILQINVKGDGKVLKSPDKDGYNVGDIVTLTAVPGTGWYFDHWEGDLSGNESEKIINLDSPKTVTAVFGTTNLLLNFDIIGEGTVTCSPEKSAYNSGEVVTLTAKPSVGWRFKCWEGDLSGSSSKTTITVDTNKSVTAVFEKEIYTINVNIEGIGEVGLFPENSGYTYGESVTLKVGSPTEWYFDHWEGDLSGNNSTVNIVVDGNKNITAVFKERGSIAGNVIIDSPGFVILVKEKNHDTSKSPDMQYFYSNSDFRFNNIVPGAYYIFFKADGYISEFRSVTVNPGSVTQVDNITLKKKELQCESDTFWGNKTNKSKIIELTGIIPQYVRYQARGVKLLHVGSTLIKQYSPKEVVYDTLFWSRNGGQLRVEDTDNNGLFILVWHTARPFSLANFSVPWSYGKTTVSINSYNNKPGGHNTASSIEYALSNSPLSASGWKSISENGTVNINSKGIWYLHVRVKDVAGNIDKYVEGPYIVN